MTVWRFAVKDEAPSLPSEAELPQIVVGRKCLDPPPQDVEELQGITRMATRGGGQF